MATEPEKFKPWDGDYDKQWYDVLLPDGEVVCCCWPNSGKMNETKQPFRAWLPSDHICVRPCADQSVEGIRKCLR